MDVFEGMLDNPGSVGFASALRNFLAGGGGVDALANINEMILNNENKRLKFASSRLHDTDYKRWQKHSGKSGELVTEGEVEDYINTRIGHVRDKLRKIERFTEISTQQGLLNNDGEDKTNTDTTPTKPPVVSPHFTSELPAQTVDRSGPGLLDQTGDRSGPGLLDQDSTDNTVPDMSNVRPNPAEEKSPFEEADIWGS